MYNRFQWWYWSKWDYLWNFLFTWYAGEHLELRICVDHISSKNRCETGKQRFIPVHDLKGCLNHRSQTGSGLPQFMTQFEFVRFIHFKWILIMLQSKPVLSHAYQFWDPFCSTPPVEAIGALPRALNFTSSPSKGSNTKWFGALLACKSTCAVPHPIS